MNKGQNSLVIKAMARVAILLLFLNQFCYGKEIEFKPLSLSEDKDRILILAPHPDDETIGAAGIIQKAVKENIPLKIVYLTYGDNNEPSFIVNQRRLVLRRKAVLMMGQLRGQEAVYGMESLGVQKDQLIFLGYPDGGMENIFTSFWGDRKPFKSMLTRVRKVPYEEALSPGSPYVGDSVVKDLKQIIREFNPTKILVSHPLDTHKDHRAFPLYLRVALWDLEGEISQPEIYGYLIHWDSWPLPRGNRSELSIAPPKNWPDKDTVWFSYDLDEDSIHKKRKAISFYKTQVGYNPSFLCAFVKKNELFAYISQVDLNSFVGFNLNDSIFYARDDQFIFVNLKSRYWRKKTTKMQMFLIGYKKGVPFDQMPKVRIDVDSKQKKIAIYNKNQSIYIPEAKVETKSKGKELFIKFPLKNLNDPDYILTSIDIRNTDLKEQGGWRLMKLKNTPIAEFHFY